ncbi:hypothetical protein VPHK567_0063 [Vibrio phage K567]|nr:type IV pilus biogenesis protein [Vibrio phage 6E35.1a]
MKRNKGFTLIEIIVLVIIIGIASSIGLGLISGDQATLYPNQADTIIEINGQTMQCTPIINLDDDF